MSSNNNSGVKTNPAIETASRFLEAIRNRDSVTFWDILDKKGQGYFLGLWFYAMENVNIDTIIKLSCQREFLDGVLGPLMESLKESIGDLLDNPEFGQIEYKTPHCALVGISPPAQIAGQSLDDEDYIPLVLELNDNQNNSGDINLTCWKIDTLNCFKLSKGVH
ncbi:MAG: hypothetical protein ACOY30_07545 [Bacillota bacterium]